MKFSRSQIPKLLLILAGTLLLAASPPSSARAQEAEIPEPLAYVSDYAQVIDQASESRLNTLLSELEEKTTAEIAVLTVKTTEPLDIFDYGMKVFDRWKPGQEGKDNGLLFLVAVEDRQMYIFTGYGLEGILPDGKVGEIRDRDVLPHFREGDYAEGIRRGVETIAAVIAADAGIELEGIAEHREPAAAPRSDLRTGLIVLVLFFFLLYWLFSRRWRARRRGSRGFGLFPWIFLGGGSGTRGGRSFGGGFSSGGFGGFGGGAAGGGGAGGGW